MRAIVFDGEQRASLACARSLASHGVAVTVCSEQRRSLTGSSNCAHRSIVAPPAAESVSAFIDWLSRSLPTLDSAILMPVTDVSTMILCHETLETDGGRFWRAHSNSYEALTDKVRLMALASPLGIKVPASEVVTDRVGACAAAERFRYPVVLKPARSKVRLDDRIVSTAVATVDSRQKLEAALNAAHWFPRAPMIVQEYIDGRGAGISSLYDHDHAIAWFAHRRLREKPPSGGVSVLSESIQLDADLVRQADLLLKAAEYRGVAMVEFRIDSAGRAYLMEVNARFWGSLQLAIDSGVDFPWLLYQLLSGHHVPPVKHYETGRRLRWFLGDIDRLLIQIRNGDVGAHTAAASFARFIGTTFDPRVRNEILRLRDPWPALFEAKQWFTRVL